jgi:hypothetical protein
MVFAKHNFFKISHFSLNFDNPDTFFKSQWQTKQRSVFFLIYRWVLAAFFIGIVSFSWTRNIRNSTLHYWFIYMTSWGILLCAITTATAAVLTTLFHFKRLTISSKSMSYKVYWFLSYVSTVLAFLITIIYWSLLFDGTFHLFYDRYQSITFEIALSFQEVPQFWIF